jgi:hypothetical protein
MSYMTADLASPDIRPAVTPHDVPAGRWFGFDWSVRSVHARWESTRIEEGSNGPGSMAIVNCADGLCRVGRDEIS